MRKAQIERLKKKEKIKLTHIERREIMKKKGTETREQGEIRKIVLQRNEEKKYGVGMKRNTDTRTNTCTESEKEQKKAGRN